jgi:hypothetical protein
MFEITPAIINANPINTNDNPVHDKKRLLLSLYNIIAIPKHCKTNPNIVKVYFFKN